MILVSLGYAALLFAIAWVGDRRPLYARHGWLRPAVYSLALAVYCSSWTFYGAVGSAVRQGIGYLPIYLGPLLMMLFGWRLLERLAAVGQAQNTVSIADFIAARYGRSQRLGAWVALMALVAAVPYLALQYKAVADSLAILGGTDLRAAGFGDPALYVAASMALFAILFGTRHVDASEHRPGLMLAVAFESLVKLVALLAVGGFAIVWFAGRELDLAEAVVALVRDAPPSGFVAQTLLAFAAIICLPRQFHVAIVECGDVADIRRARWLFGGYLVLISLMVLPIASAGIAVFGRDAGVDPDRFVLALPLSQGQAMLALMAYVGGFSAATGMVIVVSVALATMVSNDLAMPVLLRRGWAPQGQGGVARTVLWIRRLAIVGLAALAYGYGRLAGGQTGLAAFGLLAFAAVAQFAPALIGGLYWRGASRRGVEAGLFLGFGLWIYTLLLPALTDAGWFDPGWMTHGAFGWSWLRPRELFGLQGWDPLTHGTFWSLLFNVGALIGVSARWRPGLGERMLAEPFLEPDPHRHAPASVRWEGRLLVRDLQTLCERVLGEKTAQRAFTEQAARQGQVLDAALRADQSWVQFTELQLAAAVGAASARVLLASALEGTGMEVGAVVAMLDEVGQERRFNRDVLLATLQNIDQGVSVVDASMRLVAWNPRYQEIFDYPPDLLFVGQQVANLIRFNADRGELGTSGSRDVEEEIARRIAFMRAGAVHVSERVLGSGQVIELRGRPLPGGGYATSYSDVTEYKRVERELRDINENLEQRVQARTREAEQAHATRSRFLTAISHDVLQPINAARLFTSALREENEAQAQAHFAERIDVSLKSAEELLDGLLDVSRLDAGALRPQWSDIDAAALLRQLADQYLPMASERKLALRVHTRPVWVRSDRRLLRRILQNFLANALRYTRQGRIVLAARPRGDTVVLQVWDTGPGIPPQHLAQIYQEFHRYEQPFDWDGRGLGLGLSICQRISSLLGHALDARSQVGRGSMFSVAVPRATAPQAGVPAAAPATVVPDAGLAGLRVLCVDNDPDILDGMQALLARWGVIVIRATTVDEALASMQAMPDVLLVDYHLHDRLDGLSLLDALCSGHPGIPGALLTADGRDTLKRAARARGYRVLTKPVKPASLRAFLAAGAQ